MLIFKFICKNKFCNCLIIVFYWLCAILIPNNCQSVFQCRCYWSRLTNKNDVTCLLASQFVMNEGADQTQIEIYFDLLDV